ncbi:hypothetical protein Q8W71_09625 [Methylobacterium sp. NEAU 140]|uniref:hypothetical protein n=1 Tax=Methylobacterium sp. NEAU 140 TaxID=3064945 RepID=UPI002735117D|nr:hypothetical protein [Methylobacterium sp. NEAU 140]MDP4022880.1 hypothetical protein [Methylobacterium sp. NEAU 140]
MTLRPARSATPLAARFVAPLAALLALLLLLAPAPARAQEAATDALRGLAPGRPATDAEAGTRGTGTPGTGTPGTGTPGTGTPGTGTPGTGTPGTGDPAGGAPTSDAGAGPPLPFATTPALRARTVAQRVRALRDADPVAAEAVARELARHDYDAIFRGFLDGTPLRADDAGDVLAAFVVLQWMVANDARTEPSPAALRAIRARFVTPLAGRPPLSDPEARAAFAESVKLRAVLHHAGWQAARQTGTLPRFLATLPADLLAPAQLRTLALTDAGLVPRGRPGGPPPGVAADRERPDPDRATRDRPARERPGRAAAAAAPAAPLPAVPLHAANWDGVEGVYFRSSPSFGVGGLMIMDFEPLILFRDGTTFEVGTAALEDVDLAAARAAEPRRFGRWTRSATGYVLTDAKGRSDDHKLQDGQFFRAFPAPAGDAFTQSYRRLSGGGNTAMGGDVMIAVSSRYDFRADGTYGRGGSVGATNSGASTGVGTAVAGRPRQEDGRYALDRHTLTLTGPDGRLRRLFFAFGSQGDPARIDRAMIFVGDSVFTTPR